MSEFLALTVAGLSTYGCVYALTAMGLVVTYSTSGVFNLAQGAFGMVGAYLYWQLAVDFGWPSWLAFIVVVAVLAPLVGAVVERTLMRQVERAGTYAQVGVTIGLLLLLLGIATTAWSPTASRTVPAFFNGRVVTIAGVGVAWDQLVILGVTAVAAIGLRLFLYRTRAGVAARAVADDRVLTALTGTSPQRHAQLGWSMGMALAAASGILIVPVVSLNVTTLTLVVFNGYAAAMVGRMRHLPVTFATGIALGLVQSYAVGYLPVGPAWSTLQEIAPMIILVGVVVAWRTPQNAPAHRPPVATPHTLISTRRVVMAAVAFVIAGVVFASVLSTTELSTANRGVAIGIIMLSVMLTTGYGGHVSLCQLTFAGLGAYAMGKVGGASGSPVGLLAAIGLPAAGGVLLALALARVKGIYLAIATLGFAVAMDDAFFGNAHFFGAALSMVVARPRILGLDLTNTRVFMVGLCVVFVAVSVGLVLLRQGRFGRRLAAVSDNALVSSTLGVPTLRSNVMLFGLAAGIAGLGGALYGGAQSAVGPGDFSFLLNLAVFLSAALWGIRTCAGMLVAGMSLALGPVLQSHLSTPPDVVSLLVGGAAVGVARSPLGTLGGRPQRQLQFHSHR